MPESSIAVAVVYMISETIAGRWDALRITNYEEGLIVDHALI